MIVPLIITSDDDYAVAIDRLKALEFQLGNRQDDAELVFITEAMLKYEMTQSAYSDLN